MTEDVEMRRRRAAYRASHRGTKEMDVILGRFAAARLAGMSQAELDDFERFIALPDPVLTRWFECREAPPDEPSARLISTLRAFHGLSSEPEAPDPVETTR
jgi:antitoxin CptB